MSVQGLPALKGTKIISCFTSSQINNHQTKIQSDKPFNLSIRRPNTVSTGIVIVGMIVPAARPDNIRKLRRICGAKDGRRGCKIRSIVQKPLVFS